MGKNLDRGFEDREEKQRKEESKKHPKTDNVIEKTKKELYGNNSK